MPKLKSWESEKNFRGNETEKEFSYLIEHKSLGAIFPCQRDKKKKERERAYIKAWITQVQYAMLEENTKIENEN